VAEFLASKRNRADILALASGVVSISARWPNLQTPPVGGAFREGS